MASRLSVTLAAVCIVVSTRAVAAQAPPARSDSGQVRTTATAQRSVAPDLATVTLQFTRTGASPKEAGARLAARADSIRRALISLGIPRDSLVTASQYWWWGGRVERHITDRCAPSTERPGTCYNVKDTTYSSRESIEVRIRDLRKVGAVVDTALAYGITEIGNIRFQATDLGSTQEAALKEATQKARRQAEAIAEADGQRVGRVLELSTYTESQTSPRYAMLSEVVVTGSSYNAPPGTEITRPSVPVSVTVYGRWQLVEKR